MDETIAAQQIIEARLALVEEADDRLELLVEEDEILTDEQDKPINWLTQRGECE